MLYNIIYYNSNLFFCLQNIIKYFYIAGLLQFKCEKVNNFAYLEIKKSRATNLWRIRDGCLRMAAIK